MEIITNETPIDKWTPPHILVGALFGIFGTPFVLFLVINIIWELIEIPLEQRKNAGESYLTKTPESPINRGADIVFTMIGWLIGYGLFVMIFFW